MEKRKGKIRQAFTAIRERLFSKRQPKVEEKPKMTKGELSNMLRDAVWSGSERKVGLAIRAGADINDIDPGINMTPLMLAARNADKKMCLFLVRNGADIEKLDYCGVDAFTYAVKENYISGGKSTKDRAAECLIFLYMSLGSIVKEKEWTASNHAPFWPNPISAADLVNMLDSRDAALSVLGSSIKVFANAFFDCIYR